MSPILTISQIPLQFYRERRWLQRRMLPLVCILGGLAVSSAIGAFVYAPLWVGAGLLALLTILVLLVWRTTAFDKQRDFAPFDFETFSILSKRISVMVTSSSPVLNVMVNLSSYRKILFTNSFIMQIVK